MGNSTKHASSTVPLVLNPETGAVTAQFHVMFDDWFATVTSMENELLDLNSDEWKCRFGESTYQHPFDDDADDTKFLGLKPLMAGLFPAMKMLHVPLTPLALLYLCQWNYLQRQTLIPVFYAVALIRDDTPATVPLMHVVSTMLVAPTV
jgi:hypothetical protein